MHNQAVVIRSQQRPVCTRRSTGAGGVNGGCARKAPHRHRQADLPSILDCKARAPPCQLAERPNSSVPPAPRVLRLLLVGRHTLRLVVVVQLCLQQTERAARYAHLEAGAESPRRGTAFLRSIWTQRPARRRLRLFVSPPKGIHRSAGNAEASAASGSVLDRLGGATCAQPSYVRL